MVARPPAPAGLDTAAKRSAAAFSVARVSNFDTRALCVLPGLASHAFQSRPCERTDHKQCRPS
jgi:hypothetical protein